MNDPFDLSQESDYLAWRARKLSAYPAGISRLRVPVARLDRPTEAERAALIRTIELYNMVLVQVEAAQVDKRAVLSFGRALGLRRADTNLFADAEAVSSITDTPLAADRQGRSGADPVSPAARSDYIPYTNRPLSWHTDGYYNRSDSQVMAWTLFCVRPSRVGGENGLIDHEIAYIRLRDDAPHHIIALSHPRALTIPAHVHDGRTIRPESVGPVFSVREGRLHMRYSARTRHVRWRDTPETDAARRALDRLFSRPDVFTFTCRLGPGEGLLSNNVLHCRSGFEDEVDASQRRLLYRVRYLDRIRTESGEDGRPPSLDGDPAAHL
ncbi:MAG: TauD/TfdA family dioxygenase [Thiocapsa sp.]|nr:TauD/TfdA family dioxygenase [Thiocapsa sp.]MCG6985737.1 TauD/TfdA family dioxygenase [Thiocapsa sp.]